uniref:NADH dehydrogenase subunit 6 n=1 Tax=Psammotettix sp. EMHAU-2015-Zz060503 TaxID=2036857 RepID=A0A343K1G1_9HEMI|nr:NADH dehydrogenase subunit 6 [Psammotettix sp. EMHAU-2015-Zz060503]
MKTVLAKILMIISTTIPFIKTPLSMGVLLLIFTTMSSMLLSYMYKSSWMSMIMFLMFVGGLLILFMYMSSIASNEKFSPNVKLYLVMMLIIIPMEELMLNNQLEDSMMNFYSNEMITLSKIFSKKTFSMTILMFLYMFLTMIVVTKIIKIHAGPLRSKYE